MNDPGPDKLITLGRSRIQHGKSNDRIYLMHLAPEDMPGILPQLDALAAGKHYSKIFVKAPLRLLPVFQRAGYHEEARIPRFFRGRETGVFLGKYLDPRRARGIRTARRREVLESALRRTAESTGSPVRLPASYSWHSARLADAGEIALIYQAVFETYPFPIHDPEYVRRSMRAGIGYGCIQHHGKIVAVSAAEVSTIESVAEMTDFATLPEARGRRFARYLLTRMEEAMAERGILTAYTIARALSASMNKTFAATGYSYAGTLINNTQISGGLESMNVWYKPLRESAS